MYIVAHDIKYDYMNSALSVSLLFCLWSEEIENTLKAFGLEVFKFSFSYHRGFAAFWSIQEDAEHIAVEDPALNVNKSNGSSYMCFFKVLLFLVICNLQRSLVAYCWSVLGCLRRCSYVRHICPFGVDFQSDFVSCCMEVLCALLQVLESVG